MTAATLGLIDAMAGRPAKQPRRGMYWISFDRDGVAIEATYDIEGQFYPATETDPAELPAIELRSITVGGVEVFGHDCDAWAETLNVMDEIEQHEADR